MKRLVVLLALGLVAAACSAATPAVTTVPSLPPVTTAAPATTTTTVAPTTTTEGVLSTRDLFAKVSPSLAFISTDLGTGSGVLIEGGWIVTNAHVVWPFEEVRVVFPDGTEIPSAPVVRTNVYEDIAVVGPVDVDFPFLAFPDAADYAVGDTVYLVGYPGEIEEFPTPAITQGVVSRIREWEQADLTFIQTDALIAGGQSGGALVGAAGELIGVSGLGGFTEANFALVADADDLSSRIDELIAGDTPDRFNATLPRQTAPTDRYEIELDSYWHNAIFVLDEPAGTQVVIELDDDDHYVDITDAIGYSLVAEEDYGSILDVETEFDEPHFVFVNAALAGASEVGLASSHPIARLADPDDDKRLTRGVTVRGVLDISGDVDVFRIALESDETVSISLDGLSDMLLLIDQIGNPDEPLATDDDSGGGLFGTSSEIVFTAPEAGDYLILVMDNIFEPGVGYVLTVD